MSVIHTAAAQGKPSPQTGFTLIEVLIAVLVLSLGLLGMAGLQATSLKNNNAAATRGQATLLAYDMVDRMRANKAAALAGSYDNSYDTAPTSAGTDCQSTDCDANAMAAYDLNQWRCLLGKWSSTTVCADTLDIDRGLLTDGDGSISRSGNEITVSVRWTETHWNDGVKAEAQELKVKAEL